MGGSGGDIFGGKKPSEVAAQVRQSEIRALDRQFEVDASELIAKALSQTHRDVNACNARLDEIKDALKAELDTTVDMCFGGSVSKHTYVDGLSDVDMLLLLNADSLDVTPPEIRLEIESALSARLKDAKSIVNGRMCVTVTFEDFEIQLLPAIRRENHYLIPNESGREWSKIVPQPFARRLTEVNQALDGRVVPVIKLAKSIITNLPENRRPTGYHVEALAIEIFSNYDGVKTPKAMLKNFFEKAAEVVLTPIRDNSGQSRNIDDYLGEALSLERRLVADGLSKISRQMKNADASGVLEGWKRILDE